jgi:hypothetical protein
MDEYESGRLAFIIATILSLSSLCLPVTIIVYLNNELSDIQNVVANEMMTFKVHNLEGRLRKGPTFWGQPGIRNPSSMGPGSQRPMDPVWVLELGAILLTHCVLGFRIEGSKDTMSMAWTDQVWPRPNLV